MLTMRVQIMCNTKQLFSVQLQCEVLMQRFLCVFFLRVHMTAPLCFLASPVLPGLRIDRGHALIPLSWGAAMAVILTSIYGKQTNHPVIRPHRGLSSKRGAQPFSFLFFCFCAFLPKYSTLETL